MKSKVPSVRRNSAEKETQHFLGYAIALFCCFALWG